jgi:hypothetical protein
MDFPVKQPSEQASLTLTIFNLTTVRIFTRMTRKSSHHSEKVDHPRHHESSAELSGY